MPDRDPASDPTERAYVEAEAMLHDEAARAARRARVLGAVGAQAPAPQPVVSQPSNRRFLAGRGGWLAAASVAGLSAVLVAQYYSPDVGRQPPATAEAPVIAVTPNASDASSAVRPEPMASASAPAAQPPPSPPPSVSKREERRPALDVAAVEAARPPPPPPPPPPPAQAAPAPAAPMVSERLSEFADAQSRAAPRAEAARASSSAKAAMGAASPAAPAALAARLRAAAAGGRTAELSSLLARGTPVDAPDGDGETALMKAVKANQPAAAAELIRRGADPDLRDHAGESARDMAKSIDDPALNRALDVGS